MNRSFMDVNSMLNHIAVTAAPKDVTSPVYRALGSYTLSLPQIENVVTAPPWYDNTADDVESLYNSIRFADMVTRVLPFVKDKNKNAELIGEWVMFNLGLVGDIVVRMDAEKYITVTYQIREVTVDNVRLFNSAIFKLVLFAHLLRNTYSQHVLNVDFQFGSIAATKSVLRDVVPFSPETCLDFRMPFTLEFFMKNLSDVCDHIERSSSRCCGGSCQ